MNRIFILIAVLLLVQMVVPSSASACDEPDITVSPTNIDFGTIQVGSSSPSAIITITNDGDADLIIYTATIVGGDAAHFTKVNDNATGHTLSPNKSTNVSVKFSPLDTGDKLAYLRINSNDPDEDEVCVRLTGEGIGPGANLSIIKSDSPDPVSAGDDLTYTITITNNGPSDASEVYVFDMYPTESLTIQSTTPSKGSISQSLPQWAIDFLQQQFGISWPVPGYSSLTWDVGNMAAGTQANLVIVANVNAAIHLPAGSPISNIAVVFGDVADPDFNNNYVQEDTDVVPLTEPEPDIEVTPTYIDFGEVPVGTSSAPEVVTISNVGTDNLTIASIMLNSGIYFTIQSDNATGVLVPGGVAEVSIIFSPTGVGQETDALDINSDDPDEGTVNVSLSGTGTTPSSGPGPGPGPEPDIDVNPLNINFGSVQVGTSSLPMVVTITNLGNANLNIGTITVTSADSMHFSIISDSASGQSLLPGASADVSVQFNPLSTGLKNNADLSIPSNDPDEGIVNVSLSGTGTTPPPGPGPSSVTEPGPSSVPEPEPESEKYFTVDFLGRITRELASDDGRPLKSIEAPSPDGVHLLEIEAGTGASDNTGRVVTLIVIREAEAPELPDDTRLVGKAYEFKPSGTAFDKTIRLTLGYDVAQLPDGVASIGTAYYDINVGWTYLDTESSVVAEIGKLTSPVNHFTIFAILAKVAEPPPVSEPSPSVEPSSAPEMPAPASFSLSNLSIIPSISKIWDTLTFIERTGEEAVITVDVTNSGGQRGSYAATLIINGITRETKEISLDPGQTQAITFTVTDNEPGSYMVQIEALNGDFISELWINWWLITGFTALLILLCWLAWYLLRGRRQKIAGETSNLSPT
jgi:uncharacterized repeat protein (TIGR01451 family)